MWKNDFLIGLRSLRSRPGYAAINAFGLAIGIACCILIAIYVRHELSYDRFHENAECIYRVVQHWQGGAGEAVALTPGSAANALLSEIPDVEDAVRVLPRDLTVSRAPHAFAGQRLLHADSSFFNVFSFALRQGSASNVLAAPFSIVLTESAAQRYFGDEDPQGQSLKIFQGSFGESYTVTGVMEDVPSNSHMRFDGVVSFSTIEVTMPHTISWVSSMFWTYVLLGRESSPDRVNSMLRGFVERFGDSPNTEGAVFSLQPLTGIYLHSKMLGEMETGGNANAVYLLAAVAFFILILASVNHVNLAIARSTERAKEVGVRKVVGAHRRDFIRQFLTESVELSTIATAFAVLLSYLMLPAFRSLTGKSFESALLMSLSSLAMIVGFGVLVGVAAGLYPSLVLAGFRPIYVLRGEAMPVLGSERFRHALVFSQFVVTVVLIVAVGTTYRQIEYVRTKDLGYQKENVIVIPSPSGTWRASNELQARWETIPGVVQITADSRHTNGFLSKVGLRRIGSLTQKEMPVHSFDVDDDFVETMRIDVVAGRDFSGDVLADSDQGVLLNETAVHALGWLSPVEAIGAHVIHGRDRLEVLGVVSDFHFASLHDIVEPLAIQGRRGMGRPRILVRVHHARIAEVLKSLETSWTTIHPEIPFTYAILDDTLGTMYLEDQRLSDLVVVFALVAVFIACLGLYGLSSLSTRRRTKEIGIRKVMGASTGRITAYLIQEYMGLVIAGYIVAVPLSYIVMSRWLEQFAYRTNVSLSVLLSAGVLSIVVAALTVSYETIRAASSNPISALRKD